MTQNHEFRRLISALPGGCHHNGWRPSRSSTTKSNLRANTQITGTLLDFLFFFRFRLVITYHVFHMFPFCWPWKSWMRLVRWGIWVDIFSVWFDNLSWVNKKLQTRWLRWIVKCLWFTVISWVMDFVCRWTTTPDHEDCNHSHFFRITLDQPWFYGSCHWWLTNPISGICFLHQLLTYL